MNSPAPFLRQVLPSSLPGWAAVTLVALLVPRLTNATAILVFALALGFFLVLPAFLPPAFRSRFSAAPWPLRALLASFLLYSVFVLIGASAELFSLRHALDYLFLRNSTPTTGIHQAALTASALLFVIYFLSRPKRADPLHEPPADIERVRKGGSLISQEEAARITESKLAPDEQALEWAGVRFPESLASQHFAIIGGPGSGKTLSLKILMRSVFEGMTPGSNRRAIVYDAKQDALDMIAALHPRVPVRTLNPFASRGVAWDIAADVTTPALAEGAAFLLVPKREGREEEQFFSDAARLLLEAAMCAFLERAPGKWTLRDVILSTRYLMRMQTIISLSKDSEYLTEKFLTRSRTDRNIDSTIQTKLRPLSIIAAAWEMAEERFALSSFLEEESILVLGTSELAREALSNINRVLFMCLARHILNGPENSGRRTWVFVDELRDAGTLTDLDRVMLKGRSKGAAVVLGIQDLPSLEKVYTPSLARSLIGTAASKVFLANAEPETLKYASEHFKTQEIERISYSYNWGSSSTRSAGGSSSSENKGHSVSRSIVTQPVVPESLMKSLRTPSRQDLTFQGYCDTLPVGADRPYKVEVSDEAVRQLLSMETQTLSPRQEPSASPAQRAVGPLREWDEEDLVRLNLCDHPELLRSSPGGDPGPSSPPPPQTGSPKLDEDRNPLLDL